jgi:methylated-DNA-[protein]-cysteine S-methyltransferase
MTPDPHIPHHAAMPARRAGRTAAPGGFRGADHWVAQARFDSPLGPLTAAATAKGLAGLWFDGQAHHPGPLQAAQDAQNPFIAQAREELLRYWQGAAGMAFKVPLDAQGTPFQQAVWRALRDIPCGRTSTYADIALRAGSPRAVRAAGSAIGRNPLSIIVPCHRVLGRDGSLTGYAGGLQRKSSLLQHEGALPPPSGRA